MTKNRKLSDEMATAQCLGKHRYESAVLAHDVARQQRRREDSRIVAYRCHACACWHVGNRRPKNDCKEIKHG